MDNSGRQAFSIWVLEKMGSPGLNPEAMLERQEGWPHLLCLRQPSLLSQKAK